MDGVLILDVNGGLASYKVRIEHTPTRKTHCFRRIFAPPCDWTFTCSCPSFAKSRTMCKHIGACLIVHFYSAYDEPDEEDEQEALKVAPLTP